MPTPEAQARESIDAQLAATGWIVQDYKAADFTAGLGIVLREVPLTTGPCDYLSRLPFSKRASETLIALLNETDVYDDSTRFQYVSSVVDWPVPLNPAGKNFVRRIRTDLKSFTTPFEWLCLLVFLSKYGKPHEVVNVALKGSTFRDPFFARQRIAALTRGLGINPKVVKNQWRLETSMGYSDSGSVANSLREILRDGFPNKNHRLYLYLFPTRPHRIYPLQKFLVLCALAHAEEKAGKSIKRPEVLAHVTDPWYLNWLEDIQPAWF